MKWRYFHFVAKGVSRTISGVIEASPEDTPISVHKQIQIEYCRRFMLSEMHCRDVVVETMTPVE